MPFSYCYGCEFENRPTAVFCGKCGLPLVLTCTECQSVNPGANLFCDSCGTSIGEDRQYTSVIEKQNSRATPQSSYSSTDGRWPFKLKLIGLDQLIGLSWESPAPHWQWSKSYFLSWVQRNKIELFAVVFLTALAAFLRVYRLGDIPHGFHGDEAWNGLDATRILEEGWIGVYTLGALGNMAGAIYLTALTTWFFDASIFSVRLSMALFGIATIPATHLLLRLGFGRWVALLGTFALTVNHLHLHFSRIGLQLVSLPFVAVIASVALLWAMRSQRRWIWLAAGAALGLVPYTYLAFPAFFASAFVTLAVYLFLRRDELAHLKVLLGWFAIGFLIIASPFLHFLLDNWVIFMDRMGLASVLRSHEFPQGGSFTENMAFMVKRAWDASTSFVRNPRYDSVDGTGGVGAVDLGLGALFYLGLAISVRKWRSPPHLLTIMVVLSAIATQIFSDPSSGMMRRSLAAIPFIVGAAGIGATSVIGVASRQFGKAGRNVAAGALVLVLLAGGTWNLQYYFGELSRTENFKFTFAPDHIDGLAAAHSFDDPGTIYFYSGRWSFNYESIRFLFPESRGIDRSREFGNFGLDKIHQGPVTYLLVGTYGDEFDDLRTLHPEGETIVDDDEPQPRFIVYHLRN